MDNRREIANNSNFCIKMAESLSLQTSYLDLFIEDLPCEELAKNRI